MVARNLPEGSAIKPGKSKILQSKLFSDHRPYIFETALNQFLETHNVSKITYSTVSTENGMPLFTALVVYVEEVS